MKKLALSVAAAIMVIGATPSLAQDSNRGDDKWILYIGAFGAALAAFAAAMSDGNSDSP